MKPDGEKFPTFALYFQTNILQSRNITHKIMSLLNTTMRDLDYDIRKKSQRWEVKAEMRKKSLPLKAGGHFNRAE